MSKFDAVKSLTESASSGLGAGAVAALAAGPVGLVAAPVMILLGKIFHGADPRQVPASQIEQAFEAASNNLHYVAKAGMLSRDEAVAGMRVFLQKGDEFYKENEKALGKAGEKGKANMHKVIEAEIAVTQQLVATARTRSLDLVAAQALYEKPGKAGWYKESLEAAARLVDSYLTSLPISAVEKAASVVGRVASLLTAPLCESLPLPTWIVAAGVLLLGLLVGGAR